MGPPSYMRSIVDRNVVMRRILVLSYNRCALQSDVLRGHMNLEISSVASKRVST